jgi:hypothetical protein
MLLLRSLPATSQSILVVRHYSYMGFKVPKLSRGTRRKTIFPCSGPIFIYIVTNFNKKTLCWHPLLIVLLSFFSDGADCTEPDDVSKGGL